jgi:pilus assembly protein CpaC
MLPPDIIHRRTVMMFVLTSLLAGQLVLGQEMIAPPEPSGLTAPMPLQPGVAYPRGTAKPNGPLPPLEAPRVRISLPQQGHQYTLPVVPVRTPRPIEGQAPDEQFQTASGAQPPLASFVESLRGNDAALEVIVGQSRLLTLKSDIAKEGGTAVIATSDPTIIEFQVLPNPRMIRLTGKRAGTTDLSITTSDDQTYSFEIHVVYDLSLLRARLKQVFPDALLELAQLGEHLVVEGQARSSAQVAQIVQTLEAYLTSVQVPHSVSGSRDAQSPAGRGRGSYGEPQPEENGEGNGQGTEGEPAAPRGQSRPEALPETGGPSQTKGSFAPPQIINLIRVPGIHQVLLKVKIAELNRTGLREIGADVLGVDPDTGNIFGTQIGGATVSAMAALGLGGLAGSAASETGSNTTAFGIFPSGDFEILLRALRRNQLVKILAEPNLMAMSGYQASFLAGGQFPVPVPQSGGGASNNVTIEWKDFGVQLNFVPYVLDQRAIRLSVTPEVSTIDEALGTTLVAGGLPVPGLNTRRAETTVELRQGQTLAIAGLLQVEIDGQTSRIPGLGDLPYIGPLFSNTTHRRQEKELLVLVTPYLVSPMEACEVPPAPGDEIQDPNDLEFYLLNRIEGRTGRYFRSTTHWDDPFNCVRTMNLEQGFVSGPVGFSE